MIAASESSFLKATTKPDSTLIPFFLASSAFGNQVFRISSLKLALLTRMKAFVIRNGSALIR